MNKRDLAMKVSKETNGFFTRHTRGDRLTCDEVEQLISCAVDIIEDALRAGDHIAIRGFGRLDTRDVSARTVVNNANGGQTYYVPAYTTVQFTPADALKDYINKNDDS